MTGIVACQPTEETRARIQVAWDEYDKAVQVEGPRGTYAGRRFGGAA